MPLPSNHPLNIIFDGDGICSGCKVHEEKYSIDWADREKQFGDLLLQYQGRSGSSMTA